MPGRKRDFSQRTTFPGTHGNSFDLLLHAGDMIQALPAPVFALLLLLPAGLPAMLHNAWPYGLALWVFMLADWALLALLPLGRISYGPAKPPTLMLALLRMGFGLLPMPVSLVLQTIGVGLVIYGFWIEPARLTISRQSLASPRLTTGRPLRLLHLTDLHAEIAMTRREQALLSMVRAAEPDVIVFSGDFLNLSYLEDARAQAVAAAVFSQLRAPLGVFAVSGSPAVDRPAIIGPLLAGLPNVRWLQDETVMLEKDGQRIRLAGLTCTHKPFIDGPRLDALLGGAPNPAFTVLLYHTPDLAPEAAEAGVDLQLSGHTHGGQVRLPLLGAVFAGSLYGKRYEAGRLREGNMTLYVSRGIGMEGKGAPRVRFLCPPEIVIWELGAAAN